jgi:hypothetical protein
MAGDLAGVGGGLAGLSQRFGKPFAVTGGGARQPQGGIAVEGDRAERLAQILRQAGGHRAHGAHPGRMREPALHQPRLALGEPVRGHVDHDRAADGGAVPVARAAHAAQPDLERPAAPGLDPQLLGQPPPSLLQLVQRPGKQRPVIAHHPAAEGFAHQPVRQPAQHRGAGPIDVLDAALGVQQQVADRRTVVEVTVVGQRLLERSLPGKRC